VLKVRKAGHAADHPGQGHDLGPDPGTEGAADPTADPSPQIWMVTDSMLQI